jgi:iron(III) transport system ATP-binding protein
MLAVDDIYCSYDKSSVIKGISFNVAQGEIACLLGASGCGKTTALRAIAGFQDLDKGNISLAGKNLSSKGLTIAPEHRDIGMVFQENALFPHLNIARNIGFGIRSLSRTEQQKRCTELLKLVNLEQHENRFPHELSGGQQQRVALARALAPGPGLLLLDEPFSNLDGELRKRLAREVRDILVQSKTTAILVTHDLEEAFTFADQIGVVDQGRIQQWGTPFNLYHQPINQFVAGFVGRGVLLPGTVSASSSRDETASIVTELGTISGQCHSAQVAGGQVQVLLRPDDVVVGAETGTPAIVRRRVFSGSVTYYSLELPSGAILESTLDTQRQYTPGDSVSVVASAPHLITFPATI